MKKKTFHKKDFESNDVEGKNAPSFMRNVIFFYCNIGSNHQHFVNKQLTI